MSADDSEMLLLLLCWSCAVGWGTWNLFGCWGYNWTETDVRAITDALVSSGMKDAGYTYINLAEAGWADARRMGRLFRPHRSSRRGFQRWLYDAYLQPL